MRMEEGKMPEITIKFTKARDYKIITANGVWGGVGPLGDVIFDFYVEKLEVPDTQRIKVEPNLPAEELERQGEMHVRESQAGIILRPDIAHTIGKWLVEKAKEAGFIEGKGAANV
jgi:hypothetical protein